MKILLYLSDLILPLVIFYVVSYGLSQNRPVYDDFIHGAKNGLKTVVEIAPTLIGLLTAVSVLRASGLLDLLAHCLSGLTDWFRIPSALVPLILVRMFSSSAANGLVTDIFSNYGPDSTIGMAASILMSCTETILHHERVLYRGKGEENPLHAGRRAARHRGRRCGQYLSCRAARLLRRCPC